MFKVEIVERIMICAENDWMDLLSTVEEITQSLADNPAYSKAIVAELGFWADEVDMRYIRSKECETLEEKEVLSHNPIMSVRESFGTEV
jgi:hypothetical protein